MFILQVSVSESTSIVQEEKEELDFMFDEEMEKLDCGRRNHFTDW